VIGDGISGVRQSPVVIWQTIAAAFGRPYPVTWPMITLMAIVPLYVFIGVWAAGRPLHIPALAADARVPLVPAWGLVYGALYLFLILLPVFVVRDEPHVRRTFLAYLAVWLTSYAIFIGYPTAAPRPAHVAASGFTGWSIRFLYSADPGYNCFPSLHVAHSFVSALACRPVHRGVGRVAILCASLVAISTLLTRQHYIFDVVAGVALACAAQPIFLRSNVEVPRVDHRAAPAMTVAAALIVTIVLAAAWAAYSWFDPKVVS
jgi:membrane-associated phospholipid phosphatase